MEPFRSVRGGGARAWLAPAEASLLRNLVGQIMDLVDPLDSPPREGGDPGTLAALEAMLYEPGSAQAPEDPVLARLLPDAYRDDPEAAGEFRKYTEQGLRSGKAAAARTVLATLPPAGGRIRLSEPEAQAWLRAINDVRLALGTRLGVTDDFDDQVSDMGPEDPRAAYVGVYQWLAFLQETLVQALSR